MSCMSPETEERYRQWIDSPTLIGHPVDKEKFFEFVHQYIESEESDDGEDNQAWLEQHLKEDIKLSQIEQEAFLKQIERITWAFDYIVEYTKHVSRF